MKILAVVVTHNREALLKRCIHNLDNQSRPPDEILVIDNNSTDGTNQFLQKQEINFIKQENLGSAGGWFAGIKYGLLHNFDLCWLMDDDGFPDSNSLFLLEESYDKKYSCLSSLVVDETNHNQLVFPMPVLNKKGFPTLKPFRRKFYTISSFQEPQFIYPFAHLFNGALISVQAVKEIGNINKNYFLMGDEVDYFFRLKKVGLVGTLFQAKHYHPNVSERPYSDVKIYYLIKNTIINHNKYFDYPMLRNFALLLVVSHRVIKRNGVSYFFNILFNKDLILFKAFFRGINNKLGKDF